MHVKGFLHKVFSPVMHEKRLETLNVIAMGLMEEKSLSVTGLGRGIDLPIQERSGIRRADRFVGNKKLIEELKGIYRSAAEILIGNREEPEIIVDWTHIPNTKNYALRAALATTGRALTLYEEVHPEKKLGKVKIESSFLEKLKIILPERCKPIIVTDAGFRNPWFKKVEELGWDYVGRIRGTHQYWDEKRWQACKGLLKQATKKARYVGEVILCKGNEITTHLYLMKEKIKNRKVHHKCGKDEKEYGRAAREGWLLASSLSGENRGKIKRVIKIYKKRMQIEEGFRDLKSSRYGFGLERAYSRDRNRIRVLLMIAMIASLIAWLVGYAAEKKKWHYQFQVNSIKTRRVLSLFYLGCQVVKRKMEITIDMLLNAIHEIWSITA